MGVNTERHTVNVPSYKVNLYTEVNNCNCIRHLGRMAADSELDCCKRVVVVGDLLNYHSLGCNYSLSYHGHMHRKNS